MDSDLNELALRAQALRDRFACFIDDLGELAPPFSQLRAELEEIDGHLAALGGEDSVTP